MSGLSANQGSVGIAVGNVIGSNVANLTLVLGTASMVIPLTVASTSIRREAPLALAATIAFALAVRGGRTRPLGVALLTGLVVALTIVILGGRSSGNDELTSEVDEFLGDDSPIWREAGRVLIGLLLVLVSAQILVESATFTASEIGLDEGFVGLTIFAIGTSLPELATSVQAARKQETDLIIGNLLGSNVFNSLAVGGIAALAGTAPVPEGALTGIALVLMLAIAALASCFMATGRSVVRWEGGLLLILWLASLPLLA